MKFEGNLFPALGEKPMASITELTHQDVSVIKARILRGDFQHRIAADYDLNQGRISEIAQGKRFGNVSPTASLVSQLGGSAHV